MPDPTTGDLRKAVTITDDEINAAVDAVLANPKTGSYPISGGYLLTSPRQLRRMSPPRRPWPIRMLSPAGDARWHEPRS